MSPSLLQHSGEQTLSNTSGFTCQLDKGQDLGTGEVVEALPELPSPLFVPHNSNDVQDNQLSVKSVNTTDRVEA